ncbi:MAG: hypothetical protein ISS45_07140 [Candidatus Omnitrophica bacterium]|nr:hypothetical protein [Candidatus Omnitrophota bacterium]
MNNIDYLEEIKKEINYIVTHEENDDLWGKEGFGFLSNRKFDRAEKKFKELIMSQPKHQEGYEGLAYTYYNINEHEKALWFMQQAIDLAKNFLKGDYIDIEVIEEMEDNLDRMKKKKELNKWWEHK